MRVFGSADHSGADRTLDRAEACARVLHAIVGFPAFSSRAVFALSGLRAIWAFTLLPGGENAVEERHVGAQKYPRALQSCTGDKTICLPDSAKE